MNKITPEHIKSVVKGGNWIIRTDNDGVSYDGFKWNPVGEWTEAPDWNEEPICRNGLFGQDKDCYGFCKRGSRFVFCETEGEHIPVDGEKVKVRKARILLINKIPKELKFNGSLFLWGCILPDGFPIGDVGGSLDLIDCILPDGTPVDEEMFRGLFLNGT